MADTPNVIKVKGARLSYPFVYKPRGANKNKDPRFEASFLLDPSNKEHAATIAALKNEAAAVAKAKWGDDFKKLKLKLCFNTNPEDAAYCPGWFVLQTWNKERPLIVTRANVPTVSENDKEAVFAGSYVNTNTTFFPWEFKDPDTGMTKRGVSANLRSIQFVSGSAEDRFSQRGSVNADDEFEAIGEAAAVAGGDPFAD